MSATRSFYLSEVSDEVIAKRSAGGDGVRGDRSGIVERILQRYAAITVHAAPRFSEAELRLLSKILEPEAKREVWAIALLDEVISDQADRRLIEKVQRLDFAQRVALVDQVERRLLKK